jgi:hypothetical protein
MNTPEPFQACPRFARCAVNYCPLDPQQDRRQPHPADKEKRCTLPKSIRARIGADYPGTLARGGLTPKEFSAAQVWANLPAAERQAIADRGREALAARQMPEQPENGQNPTGTNP